MPNRSADPALVTATPTVFRAEDAADARFFLFATLVSGVLRFEVVARLPAGERGAVSGKRFFAAMMAHFGGRVKMIEGDWTAAGGLSTNLDLFNRATAAGLPAEDAAALTWTGRRASECGFDRVTVVHTFPLSAPGRFTEVRVHFAR